MPESKIGKLFINRKNRFNPFNVNDSQYYTVVVEEAESLSSVERNCKIKYVRFAKGSMREDMFEDVFVEVDITKVNPSVLMDLYVHVYIVGCQPDKPYEGLGTITATLKPNYHLKGVVLQVKEKKVLQRYFDIVEKEMTQEQYQALRKGIIK